MDMEMDKKSQGMRTFRESFRGYRKEDVNAYLEQMHIQFSKKEENYRKEIAELRGKGNTGSVSDDIGGSLIAENNELKSTVSDLNMKLSELRKSCGDSENLIAAMRAEDEQIRAENLKLKQELLDLKIDITKAKSNGSDDENVRQKAEMYDKMSIQLGDMMITANKNADQIISEATKEAESLRASAAQEIEEYKEDAKRQIEKAVYAARLKLAELSNSYISDYSDLIEEAHSNFGEITEQAQSKFELLKSRADKIREIADDELKKEFEVINSNRR